jgi:hypothetical protein
MAKIIELGDGIYQVKFQSPVERGCPISVNGMETAGRVDISLLAFKT